MFIPLKGHLTYKSLLALFTVFPLLNLLTEYFTIEYELAFQTKTRMHFVFVTMKPFA